MTYQGKKETQAPEHGKKGRSEEQFGSEQVPFSLPNSLVMQNVEDPAEPETGTVPGGVNFRHESSHAIRQAPAPVRTTVSGPYGVIQRDGDDDDDDLDDFEHGFVRVGSDKKEQAEGDIDGRSRIGSGEEHPAGAAAAAAAEPAAADAEPDAAAPPVRENAGDDDRDFVNLQNRPESGGFTGLEDKIISSFYSTEFGEKVRKGIEGDLKSWIKNGTGKRRKIEFSWWETPVRFMIRAAYKDYLARDILLSIAAKPIANDTDAKARTREYKALIKQIAERTGPYDLEIIAEDTGLLPKPAGAPDSAQAPERRPYEFAPDVATDSHYANASATVSANSRGDRALQRVFADIDEAQTPEEAYKVFAAFTGNTRASLLSSGGKIFKKKNAIDMNNFRTKLKYMACMVRDFPELRHKIGNMYELPLRGGVAMATKGSFSGGYKADIGVDPLFDQAGGVNFARIMHDDASDREGTNIAHEEYNGTHELGHVLAGTLVDETMRPDEARHEMEISGVEGALLEETIERNRDMMASEYNLSRDVNLAHGLTRLWADSPRYGKSGQISTQNRLFTAIPPVPDRITNPGEQEMMAQDHRRKPTSTYGSTNAGEFFAEAFADVYAHGNQARPMSIAIVKEYERRQKERQMLRYRRDAGQ